MCGIFSRREPEAASTKALEAMLSVTQHRGRDGRLTYVEPMDGVALAYCHSAAFGQRKGSPTWQEDAGAVAAVDGDIYDTPAHLQGRLPSVGSPDANAVIATWESDAANFPGKLDGFFSLFLWDKKEKTLVLCTDPMGHKLVYYYEEPERGLVVFSTELKTVLAHPAVPRQLDEAILPLHLAAGLTPASFTLAKGVRTMQPAECLTFSPDEANAKRYWLPTLEAGPDEVDYWATRTRSELREAVGRIAGGADNVAVYLSGGVDSSTVLAALKECHVPNIQAFTLAFKGDVDAYDLPWAERVASVTGTQRQTVTIDPEADITPELMSTLFQQMDEPFSSAGRLVSEYFLSQASIRAGFNSVLNGSANNFGLRGAREQKAADACFDSRTPKQVLRAAFERGFAMKEEYINNALVNRADMTVLDEAAMANLEVLGDLDLVQTIQLDRALRSATGRFGLFYQYIAPLSGSEERSPFLDPQMALFVLSVPAVLKGFESSRLNKAPLRESFRDVLQIDISQREKRGFASAPSPAWLNRILIASLKPLADDGIVKNEYLVWLEKNIEQGRRRAKREAWQWFVFNCWYQFQIKQFDPFAIVK